MTCKSSEETFWRSFALRGLTGITEKWSSKCLSKSKERNFRRAAGWKAVDARLTIRFYEGRSFVRFPKT